MVKRGKSISKRRQKNWKEIFKVLAFIWIIAIAIEIISWVYFEQSLFPSALGEAFKGIPLSIILIAIVLIPIAFIYLAEGEIKKHKFFIMWLLRAIAILEIPFSIYLFIKFPSSALVKLHLILVIVFVYFSFMVFEIHPHHYHKISR